MIVQDILKARDETLILFFTTLNSNKLDLRAI